MFSEQAMTILKKRYLHMKPDGTQEHPMDMFNRVATAIGRDEEERDAFYDMMRLFDFLPNSPTLMNAGKPNGQLSACFVIPIDDSMESIFDAVKLAAMIHKSGGGTGFSFSKLRPEGDKVGSTGGVASGPVSFMKVFNAATEAVKQGGTRRGANMSVLNVDHADIEKFIHCKDTEGELANFNISVGITDYFMRAVENDGIFWLHNPRDMEDTKSFTARSLMRQIAESAWKTGEPGVVFLDAMNRDNPTPQYGEYSSTNPCHRGDNLVHTTIGVVPIRDLVGKKFGVITPSGKIRDARAFATGFGDLWRVKLANGMHIDLTEHHNLIDASGNKIMVKDLHPGTMIALSAFPIRIPPHGDSLNIESGRVLGWLSGNGWWSFHSNSRVMKMQVGMCFSLEDRQIGDMVIKYMANVSSSGGPSLRERADKGTYETCSTDAGIINHFLHDLGAVNKRLGVPETVMRGNDEFRVGFLQGLFSSDGSVSRVYGKNSPGRRITLTTAYEKMAHDVHVLLSSMGIHSTCREATCTLPGRDKVYQRYDIVIYGESFCDFMDFVGFIPGSRKQLLAEEIRYHHEWRSAHRKNSTKVISVENLKVEEPVYNLTVEDDTHQFSVNGIISANCGEQPLLPYESCNLGSINLANMVKNGAVDWDKLEATAKLAARFLDRVIDANCYPTEAIREATLRTRKIGLGVMGWADMLVKLGIPYDSDKALGLAEDVMHIIRAEALLESIGKNATVTTIAPTGTLSIIAGVNSGIEPFFALKYDRKNALGEGTVVNQALLNSIKGSAKSLCDSVIESVEKHGNLETAQVDDEFRALFKTSHEIPWQQHIRMQAAFQKFTDNAVSKTINMPHDATVEDVEAAYMMAWKEGCKGITVYRDGCREQQVYNLTKKEPGKRERPEVTFGMTRKIRLGCDRSLYVTVNNDDEGLCEVFAETGKAGGCIGSHTEGLARVISLALRSGVNVDAIVDQLSGIRCDRPKLGVLSCSDAIAKALSLSGKTDEVYKPKMDVAPECPSCGGHVEMRDGCIVCVDCGESRCG
jgi:ribonucleoside-diphosphate reductase alpha chain